MTYANNFLYPYRRYRGAVKPENLVFDANLQEFSQRVSFICNLENNGKLTPEDAFQQLQQLWLSLDQSRRHLGIKAKD